MIPAFLPEKYGHKMDFAKIQGQNQVDKQW